MNPRDLPPINFGLRFLTMVLISLLLILVFAPTAKHLFAQNPTKKATLEVQVIGDPDRITWGTSRTVNTPEAMRFQWKPDDPRVLSAVWKVRDGVFVVGQPDPPIVATGVLSQVPAQGQSNSFWIDFKRFLSRKPPDEARKYYVQIFVLDSQKKEVGISNAIEISYVKGQAGSPFPWEDPLLKKLELRVTTRLNLYAEGARLNVDINFRSGSKRTVPQLDREIQWKTGSEHVLTIPFDQPIDLKSIKNLTLWTDLDQVAYWDVIVVPKGVFTAYFDYPVPVISVYPIEHRFTKARSKLTIPIDRPHPWKPYE